MTFDRILPRAGEPAVQQSNSSGDLLGNWDLFDDEPLPRENGGGEDKGMKSSRKIRELKMKMMDDSGQSQVVRSENGKRMAVGRSHPSRGGRKKREKDE